MSARLRQLAPVLLVLGLTVAGFFLARAFGERDARRDSQNRGDIAATQVRDRVAQAAALVDGVRRLLAGHVSSGVTTEQFADIGGRWLSPVGLPAAAWVQRVSAQQRSAYERRIGHSILALTPAGVVPTGTRKSYLPATLVTGIRPMIAAGIDLGNTPGVTAAVSRPQTAYRVAATPLAQLPDGATGLFLVQSAQRLSRGIVEPGYVVLFLPASWLLAAGDTVDSTQTSNQLLRITVGGVSAGISSSAATTRSTFSTAGQRFDVRVPRRKVHGAAELLPWIILAGGLAFATLAGALGVIAARRAKAKAEVDRLFTISPDLIVVAGFDGYFKRVNPTFEALLGYTSEEALSRPYVEFVHPDDRERTEAESSHLREGETTISFANRYVCKNGSYRWIEWTATPVTQERLIYAVARDVTERRQAEIDLREAEQRNRALAEEQAALRRVATLVAHRVPLAEILAALAEEVGRLVSIDGTRILRYEGDGTATVIAGWSESVEVPAELEIGARLELEGESVSALVFRTARPARIDRYSDATGPLAEPLKRVGVRSAVGVPIMVEGQLWGAIVAGSLKTEPLPFGLESRLAEFTELAATAIANAENRAEVVRLAEQQAALRRVATLVARRVPPGEIFAAVADEVAKLLPVTSAAMGRYDADGLFTTVAASSTGGVPAFPVGGRWVPEGRNITTLVLETGRPARMNTFADASGPVGVAAREAGYRSAVGSPIIVEGRLWGVMSAASTAEDPLPSDTEARLASFTDLVATGIADAESRGALAQLAEEQAALRRVATLVAEGVAPEMVFATLCEEISRLLDAQAATIGRLEPDGRIAVLAITGTAADESALGARLEPESLPVTAAVLQTGRSARKDNYAEAAKGILRDMGIRSGVGVPIFVEGALWGAIGIGTLRERFPDDTEQRLEKFTQLAATAIADAESRAGLARIAQEQAALRRVATLVAEGVPPAEVFSTLCLEVNQLLDAQTSAIVRLEADETVTVVASGGITTPVLALGTRLKPESGWVLTAVLRTGRPARKDDYREASGRMPGVIRDLGISSSVAVPIVVEGKLWGVIIIGKVRERFPDQTGQRLEAFTELAATAIANAESRSELAASRARVVAASDETRRQIERDLHDGTQQRLVSLALALRATEDKVPPELDEVRAELSRTASGLADAVEDLQEISRGIHPAILSRGGLAPALETLAGRAAVPVQLETRIDRRLPESVEVAAYYIVSEALTNAAKHAHASEVQIEVRAEDSIVELAIHDDGLGGADPSRGSGLIGLRDRVEALGGTIDIVSGPGVGTSLRAVIPTDGGNGSP